MRSLFVLLVIVALALTACGQSKDVKDQTTDLPPPPPPPMETEQIEEMPLPSTPPATDEAAVIDDATEIYAGEQAIPIEGKVGNINCNAAERKLTFTLSNDGQITWSLDQEAGFPAPADLVDAEVFINNYESNMKTAYYDRETSERLFGPDEKFSENCGGVTKLAPGEQATCTLYPVPLNQEDEFANKNQIWVKVPNNKIEYVRFTCE